MLNLLSKKNSELTEQDRERLVRFHRRFLLLLASFYVVATAAFYASILAKEPSGPPRTLVLSVMNACTLSIVLGIGSFYLFRLAGRLRPLLAVPAAVAAASMMLVGAAALPDVSLRLKTELAKSQTALRALTAVADIAFKTDGLSGAEIDDKIRRSADALRDYGRVGSFKETFTAKHTSPILD